MEVDAEDARTFDVDERYVSLNRYLGWGWLLAIIAAILMERWFLGVMFAGLGMYSLRVGKYLHMIVLLQRELGERE